MSSSPADAGFHSVAEGGEIWQQPADDGRFPMGSAPLTPTIRVAAVIQVKYSSIRRKTPINK